MDKRLIKYWLGSERSFLHKLERLEWCYCICFKVGHVYLFQSWSCVFISYWSRVFISEWRVAAASPDCRRTAVSLLPNQCQQSWVGSANQTKKISCNRYDLSQITFLQFSGAYFSCCLFHSGHSKLLSCANFKDWFEWEHPAVKLRHFIYKHRSFQSPYL